MRRSPRDFLEITWNFFASVRVATALIFVIAVASVAGTVTGRAAMYTAWWYLSLLFLLAASLVVCSIGRFLPLWRSLHSPASQIAGPFVSHLPARFTYPVPQEQSPLASLAALLKARRYRVRLDDAGGLYAEKGRWGRWGPYITHIGLLVILAGAMSRAIPGAYFDAFIWVQDGATARVPQTSWYVRNNRFAVEYYPGGGPKAYHSDLSIIEAGRVVQRATVAVNQPLTYKGVQLYQQSFRQELADATVTVRERGREAPLGSLAVDLAQPQSQYAVGEYRLQVRDYFPDFVLDAGGTPTSRSSLARNPAFVLQVWRPGLAPTLQWFFLLHPELQLDPASPLILDTQVAESVSTTGLQVKRDRGVPVIYLGLLLVSLGVFASFYLSHRRYWARVEGDWVLVGGWAYRHPRGLRAEMAGLQRGLQPQAGPPSGFVKEEER